MLIQEILNITDAELINDTGAHDIVLEHAFASDLMSDVLTINSEKVLLITGLNNLQTIRTAEMAEVKAILFGRNKRPSDEMIELANKEGITLLATKKSVFHTSGLLFSSGLKPVF